jgi:hypothetical protein
MWGYQPFLSAESAFARQRNSYSCSIFNQVAIGDNQAIRINIEAAAAQLWPSRAAFDINLGYTFPEFFNQGIAGKGPGFAEKAERRAGKNRKPPPGYSK